MRAVLSSCLLAAACGLTLPTAARALSIDLPPPIPDAVTYNLVERSYSCDGGWGCSITDLSGDWASMTPVSGKVTLTGSITVSELGTITSDIGILDYTLDVLFEEEDGPLTVATNLDADDSGGVLFQGGAILEATATDLIFSSENDVAGAILSIRDLQNGMVLETGSIETTLLVGGELSDGRIFSAVVTGTESASSTVLGTAPPAVIPLPAGLPLALTGAVALGLAARRRRR